MDLGLRGKKAIVTGATRGIGRAIVEMLAAEGCDVGFCARNEDEVQEATTALRLKGVNVHRRRRSTCAMAMPTRRGSKRPLTDLGGCDVFVPCVSAGAGMDSEKNWWKCFEVDVLHTVRGCETLMERLKASGQGAIVIISSTNAIEVFGGPMAYNAMKAGLINYAKQLANFVGKSNVRVNTVTPGPDLFRRRRLGNDQGHQREVLRVDPAPDSIGPHGLARGSRSRRGVPGQPGGKPGNRR